MSMDNDQRRANQSIKLLYVSSAAVDCKLLFAGPPYQATSETLK